jgi:hypothetical protein
VGQRLVHDAVPFGQADQRVDLLGVSLGIQVDGQADGAEPDRRVLADRQRPAEVQVTLGGDGSMIASPEPGSRYRTSEPLIMARVTDLPA